METDTLFSRNISPGLHPSLLEDIDTFYSKQGFDSFERGLKSSEDDAREKYLTSLQKMDKVVLSDWFFRFLRSRVIPVLNRIGYEESFEWAIFRMTAPSWETMGPISDKEIWFNPTLIRAMEDIRVGVLLKSDNDSKRELPRNQKNQKRPGSQAKREIDFSDLEGLISDISTSWIILPRAYHLLEKQNSRILAGYLRYLNRETNRAFWRILAGITIEFVGNFALKYISDSHDRDRMINVLFYGYAAMFWKNLRNPPKGLEDMRICDSFFHWSRHFMKRSSYINADKKKTIDAMAKDRDKVFPVTNAFGTTKGKVEDYGSILVALRHGEKGIETAVKTFGIGGRLLVDQTDSHLPFTHVPYVLWNVLQGLREHFPAETLATRKTIRTFLLRLKNDYDSGHVKSFLHGGESDRSLKFTGPRVLQMVRHFFTSTEHYV